MAYRSERVGGWTWLGDMELVRNAFEMIRDGGYEGGVGAWWMVVV
jgi:hypothetical protein